MLMIQSPAAIIPNQPKGLELFPASLFFVAVGLAVAVTIKELRLVLIGKGSLLDDDGLLVMKYYFGW